MAWGASGWAGEGVAARRGRWDWGLELSQAWLASKEAQRGLVVTESGRVCRWQRCTRPPARSGYQPKETFFPPIPPTASPSSPPPVECQVVIPDQVLESRWTVFVAFEMHLFLNSITVQICAIGSS